MFREESGNKKITVKPTEGNAAEPKVFTIEPEEREKTTKNIIYHSDQESPYARMLKQKEEEIAKAIKVLLPDETIYSYIPRYGVVIYRNDIKS